MVFWMLLLHLAFCQAHPGLAYVATQPSACPSRTNCVTSFEEALQNDTYTEIVVVEDVVLNRELGGTLTPLVVSRDVLVTGLNSSKDTLPILDFRFLQHGATLGPSVTITFRWLLLMNMR